jgi:outer membrane protein OmpA-like peptidoglycan-associated protein
VLNQSAIATLASLAGMVHQLINNESAAGGTVTVELTGRTDPSGADETNAALAQRRVDAVAGWLKSSGIESRRLISVPVATGNPLEASDASTRARINRSVSFKVGAAAAQSTPGGH